MALTIAKGSAAAADSNTTQVERYEAATKMISKRLIAPATARFSTLGKDEEAKLEVLSSDAWEATGFVDSQNFFGALLRQGWRIILKQTAEGVAPLYLKIGNEELGTVEEARFKALSVEQQEAIAKERREKAEMDEKKAEESAKARAAIERREFHRQARSFIATWGNLPENVRHSTLGETDDQFTACRALGNDVWEARGVTAVPGRGEDARTRWRVLFWVKADGNTEAGTGSLARGATENSKLFFGAQASISGIGSDDFKQLKRGGRKLRPKARHLFYLIVCQICHLRSVCLSAFGGDGLHGENRRDPRAFFGHLL